MSQWTRIFGPAIIVMELLAVAAAEVSGDWNLPWLFPLFLVFFPFRVFLIGFLFLWPVLIAVIVVWGVYTHSKEKREKRASLEAQQEGGQRPLMGHNKIAIRNTGPRGRTGRYRYYGIPLPGIGYVEP